jgi:N-acetyl-gamma-glutamyl-phosphate reductase
MIKIGMVGATGYSGIELIKLLLNHPQAEIKKLFGHSTVGSSIGDAHPSLRNMISLEVEKYEMKALDNLDLLFVAMPSGQAMTVIAEAGNAGVKVIDLGGDFRLKDPNVYSKYYKHEHTAAHLLNGSVYGLSEWNENAIKTAKLIANPGCYPTSVLLALLPLIKYKIIDQSFISIVSYSGTSGAGKAASANMIFSEVNESVRAYKVGNHQHIPEIKQYLEQFGGSESSFSFIPHLLPVTRGIYTTIQTLVKEDMNEKDINNAFNSAYLSSPFIRIFAPRIPEMKDVLYTNFCDIGYNLLENKILTVFSTIDNLVKGAAGQAIQNMNIMFGLEQTEGLLRCRKKD